MKKMRWIVAGICIVFLLLYALLSVIMSLDESHMGTQPPLSQEALDAVKAGLTEAAKSTPAHTVPPAAPETAENHPGGPVPQRPKLHKTYFAVGSQQTRVRRKRNRDLEDVATEKLIETMYAGSHFFGEAASGAWACELASEKAARGEWDAARYLYRKALAAPLDPQRLRYCCIGLAKLEEDPEKAARLLELSLLGDENGTHYGSVIHYCKVTGSTELETYYLAELRQKFPDRAERMFPSVSTDLKTTTIKLQ